MFNELLDYNLSDLDSVTRTRVADILKARSEMLRATAEVAELRARIWAGEESATALAELKADELKKFRASFTSLAGPFLKGAVDVDGMLELLPMVIGGVLQNVKVPIPVILEVAGVDVDGIKDAIRVLKKLAEELSE